MAPPDLVQEFSAMARDFAAIMHSGRGTSNRRGGARQRVETSALEPLRPSDLIRGIGQASGFSAAKSSARRTAQFANDSHRTGTLTSRIPVEFFMETLSKLTRSLQGLRSVSSLKKLAFSFRTVASLFVAALIGVGAIFVWQAGVSGDPSPAAQPTGLTTKVARVSMQNPAPKAAAVGQTELPLATTTASPPVTQQLEAIARNLASLQISVQQLAARQEDNTRNIATLQAIAAKEPTQNSSTLRAVIEKQIQMAQDIATLQKSPSLQTDPTSTPRPKKLPNRQAAAQPLSDHLPPPVGLPFLDGSP
jgi:hypothetical protein